MDGAPGAITRPRLTTTVAAWGRGLGKARSYLCRCVLCAKKTKKKGRFDPPLYPFSALAPCSVQFATAAAPPSALPNTRYFSLPTKPNLVTFEALIRFSTLAERS